MILLVGKSGSGKSTLVKKLNLKEVVSHTTRSPREGEIDGVDKWFHSSIPKDLKKKDIIAQTWFNNHYYWATKKDLKGKDVYVIDWCGVLFLEEVYKDKFYDTFKVVYVECNNIKLLYRLIKRDGFKKGVNRFLHDRRAFNKDYLKVIKHEKVKG